MQQGWLIPFILILFLAFALADWRSTDPLFPEAQAAAARSYTLQAGEFAGAASVVSQP
jgi:hypothetical protein